MKKKSCQEWDSNPRPQRGPERSFNPQSRQGNLESGALDRSAILTLHKRYDLLSI
jgi:hypothetical protein